MWGALIGAAANLAGTYMTNEKNEDIANRQMEFQGQMSGSAYQRAVNDMKKAGINPMMASQLGGSSTPPGASYQAENILAPAVNSAQSNLRLKEELNNMRMTGEKIKTEAALNDALTAKATQDARASAVNSALASLAIPAAQNAASIEQSKFGKPLAAIDRVMESVGLGANSLKDVRDVAVPRKGTIFNHNYNHR